MDVSHSPPLNPASQSYPPPQVFATLLLMSVGYALSNI